MTPEQEDALILMRRIKKLLSEKVRLNDEEFLIIELVNEELKKRNLPLDES